MSIMVSFRKKILTRCPMLLCYFKVPLPAQQSLFFPIPEQGFGGQGSKTLNFIDTSETLDDQQNQVLSYLPYTSDLDCLMRHLCVGFSYIKDTILHRAQYLVSASSGPLKGFVMPVSLRAQWSSERSSKNSSSPSLPYFLEMLPLLKKTSHDFLSFSVVSLTCTSLCQVLCRCVDAKCANT